MTCFQRMHEVILGTTHPTQPIDWDAILWDWLGVTDVHDRDHMLERMGIEPIDVYDLPRTDLSRFTGLIISGRVDQELLYRERARIRAFLDGGKTIVFSGQVFKPWLPGASQPRLVDLASLGGASAVTLTPHVLFDGLTVDDLTPAVFVHGTYPLPPGAETLAALPDGSAVVYVDRVSSGGTLLVHAGGNLMGYVAVDNDARQVIPLLLAWIDAEAEAHAVAGSRR
jgi:hypothetical protein